MAKVREKVMNQCKTAFEVIKKANGYNTDVMTVSRIPSVRGALASAVI